MRISEPSGPVRCACFLALLTVSACGAAVPPDKPSAAPVQPDERVDKLATPQGQSPAASLRPDAVVAGLYKEVVARHPIAGRGDRKVFGPYLSKGLLHRFEDNAACFDDWYRQNPGSTDKPPFGQLNMGAYSGTDERSNPQTFHIERTETGKDGSSRVYVKLTYAEPTFELLWYVAVVVVRENGRPLVDDVIYLRDKDEPEEYRLSQVLGDGCKGPRWVG